MEANFFRRLAQELGPRLSGQRIEKVFGPGENVWTLKLSGPRDAPHLVFRPAKSAGLLFLAKQKPPNPESPAPQVMWLRKRLSGRRLLDLHLDWPGLRLAWGLSPSREPDAGRFLVLDVRQGLFLADELDESFDRPAAWPELASVLSDAEVWRDHPQISPALRRQLSAGTLEQAQALYANLVEGKAERFFVGLSPSGARPPLAWDAFGADGQAFDSAGEAAAAFGERLLFPQIERERDRVELAAAAARRRKLTRTLAKLKAEEQRLRDMTKAKAQALALQSVLYTLAGRPLPERLDLPGPDGVALAVALDQHLSAPENMAALFKRAAKGERGLEHLARRRRELAAELARVESTAPAPADLASPTALPGAGPRPATLPRRLAGVAAAAFRSSEGFLILRGRNDTANHELVRRAAPCDLWLHVAGGPGCHVILKRDFPTQEVPRRTLEEAAALAGLKSFRSREGKADVLVALAKDVRIPKDAKPGQVVVGKIRETLRVELDPQLEARLG